MKTILILLLSITSGLVPVWAQMITLKTDQDPLIVKVRETRKLNIVAVNEKGTVVGGGILIYQMLRQEGFVPTSGANVDSLGNVTGHSPGIYNLIVIRTDPDNRSFAKSHDLGSATI